jgi:GH43 family beta-xylosidase
MYTNPVYPHECADPFVLYFDGSFWCYRTGHWADGRIFGILHSSDLIHWDPVGGAMQPLAEGYPYYWAPEVHYENGIFYLYYSTGNEVNMHMRVATSDLPTGPFIDTGRRLTQEVFAIDGHVFVDDDGTRYFFYATDFLDVERAGTGTVVDRMIDPLTLEGQPAPVSLAKYDWQIYDPRRAEKNNLRWHTIEGSFTLKYKGRYYQMFSGGNYQNISYGVGYAVTEDIRSREEWQQSIDGMNTLPILKTIPGLVSGPGHNSVVAGPDHRQLYCVYHVIQPKESLERVLAVDRIEWVGERLVVLGPSFAPTPTPIRAAPLASLPYHSANGWQVGPERITQPQVGDTALTFDLKQPAFLLHSFVRALAGANQGPVQFGLLLHRDDQELARLSLDLAARQMEITIHHAAGPEVNHLALEANFNVQALHLWRMDLNHQVLDFQIGSCANHWQGLLPAKANRLSLFTTSAAAEFAFPEVTFGSQELFIDDGIALQACGWTELGGGSWEIAQQCLLGRGGPNLDTLLVKNTAFTAYEWVVNVRLVEGSGLLLWPAYTAQAPGPRLRLTAGPRQWMLQTDSGQTYDLPASVNGTEFHQLRIRKQGGTIQAAWLDQELFTLADAGGPAAVAIGAEPASLAAFELVRITSLEAE